MTNLFEQRRRYSIRKLSVGVCSALIGLSALGAVSVSADDGVEELLWDNSRAVQLAGEDQLAALPLSPEQETEGSAPVEESQPVPEVAIMASPASTQVVGNVGIKGITAKSGANTSPQAVLDGNPSTSWQSVPSVAYNYESMDDHNRVLDVALDGTYALTELNLKQLVDGSYNNYYVYASEDGQSYKRIAAKMDDRVATAQGDTYVLDNVRAAYLRINMAYNSNRFVTNLAELGLKGKKLSDEVPEKAPITVESWADSHWKEKWDRFEQDKAYATETVVAQMGELVGRVIGQQWKDKFTFEVTEVAGSKDTFEVDNRGDQGIVIRGNNGLALASGFNYYLKNYAKVDYDPVFASNTKFEGVVPVEALVKKEANFDHRYALNYTTFSYTMAFWNWDEYEKFLDWSAMNGINLMLDIVGQEEVLRQTLREFNYTDQEIKDYIPGPAYYAWFYMQNLYSIGGPLPDNWFAQRVELGRRIHDRMQTYGIKPVIQAFSGQVPVDFARKNPDAVLSPKDHWPSFVRPAILKTYLDDSERQAGKQDYFSRVADVFYDKQKAIFGDVSHYYSTDPFHEGGNAGNLDITKIYKTVQDKMLAKDPQAIWVLQQWQGNLDARRMRDLDKTKLLALDLQTDMRHEHGLFENNGTPWVYNVLHNFGGRMGADGNLTKVAVDPITMSKKRQHMVGIGLTAEALENSPAVYGLLFDTNWSKDPINIKDWLDKYAERRAGGDSTNVKEAWKLLLETAYRDKGRYYQGAPESVINARPSDHFKAASTWGHSDILYDKEKLDQALKFMLASYDQFKDSEAYRYDVAELAAQVLSNGAKEYYDQMVAAKADRDLDRFNRYANEFLKAIDLSDQLAGATQKFMLGNWINTARKMLPDTDDWTSDLFEANARTIITTWGTEKSGSLKDYSNRKWSGLTADFYKKRWEIWIRNRQAELSGQAKRPEDQKAESNWYLWESRWTNLKSIDDQQFASQPNVASLGSLARSVLTNHSYTAIRKKLDKSLIENSNLALGKTFETVSTSTAGQPAFLSDGLTDYSWQPKGDGRHVLEVDLEGTYRLSSINLAFPQLATQFPYDLEVSAFNPLVGDWQVLVRENSRALEANEQLATDVVANKVRFSLATRSPQALPLKINEIEIFGHALEAELTNLVKGAPATTNKTNTATGFPLSHLTDDNDNNLWKTTDWGPSAYPARVSVPVPVDSQVEHVDVVFESANRPFKFMVTVTELDGRETILDETYREHTGTLAQKTYRVPVGRAIKSASVQFLGITGQGPYGQSGPALSELRVMGYPRLSHLTDLAHQQLPTTNKTNTNDQFPLTNITDNNPATYWKTTDWGAQAYPAEVALVAPADNQVDHLAISFEKAGLPFKFSVSVTEQDGTETVVYDQFKDHSGVLASKDFHIPVGRAIKGAKISYHGITGKGEFYAAGPALAEFKLMGYVQPKAYTLADYSRLDEQLQRVPQQLEHYTSDSLAPLQDLLGKIGRNREAHEQAIVDGWATALSQALSNLAYKPANYQAVDQALSRKPSDLSLYTPESLSALTQAEQAIVRGKTILDQSLVDGWATALSQALGNLAYKPADYQAVDQALSRKPSNLNLYTPESLSALTQAEQAIVRGKTIIDQPLVDGWATALTRAIAQLVLKTSTRTRTDVTPIDFITQEIKDPNLDEGKTVVEQEGRKGSITKTIEETLDASGQVISSRVINTVTQPPQPKVVRIGSKVTEKRERRKAVEIPFETITREDNTKDPGYRHVETPGVKGSEDEIYEDIYVNGVKQSEGALVIRREKRREPVTEVVVIGTRKTEQRERKVPVSIPFETDRIEDANLNKGIEVVEQEGRNGSVVQVYQDTYVNGQKTVEGTTVIREENRVEPVNKRVRVGTKEVPVTKNGTERREATEPVAFTRETIKDATLPIGEEVLVRVGVAGERKVVYEDTYVNGQVTSSREVSSTITRTPVSEVVRVGTKVVTPPTTTPARELKDPATGVVVKLSEEAPAGIVDLRITHKETKHVATPTVLKDKDYDLFDIDLIDQDGNIVKLEKASAEVSLPVDAGKTVEAVVYLPNSDQRENLEFTVKDTADGRVVVFTAKHFSEYGIVYKSAPSTGGQTDASTPPSVPTILTPLVTGKGEQQGGGAAADAGSKVEQTAPLVASASQGTSASTSASLPNTGEAGTGLVALGATALISALGLAGVRRKEGN